MLIQITAMLRTVNHEGKERRREKERKVETYKLVNLSLVMW